ncbi:hypothetical protein KTO58_26545 [Chitinophaga pendula]|uniref:hypothetical protein n=1 Tax=Chitinophaga TaxID=79328 RepID=UPI000BAF908E|nr:MULTISPECIES: hypothetical protein [Chitinophaga]ASZ09878.1 hypothetical protein CK934_02225 [Chitinophaga sp. MD30]UCJ07181.1 hypothetical protein KTO58_26545 [Chitinophaga pendula]
MKRTNPQNGNMLFDIHSMLFDTPITFREKVCEQCSWSVPTFYRKMKSMDRVSGKKLISALSNAEVDMIMKVFDEVYRDTWNYFDKYRK